MKNLGLTLASLLAFGCAAAAPGPPAEMAIAIIAHLDADRVSEARREFARVASDDDATERMYPVLLDSARTRFESGDWAGSTRVLSFMAESYSNATAVREALVYALFLERAVRAEADEDLMTEMIRALDDIERTGMETSVWVDLARSQVAIDEGDLTEARRSFGRFLGRWDGSPTSILAYVEDIDRYLASN